MKPSTEWWRYLAPLAVIAIIALLPVPAGLENHTWLYFAVFTGVIVGLILEPVPGAVVAMVGILARQRHRMVRIRLKSGFSILGFALTTGAAGGSCPRDTRWLWIRTMCAITKGHHRSAFGAALVTILVGRRRIPQARSAFALVFDLYGTEKDRVMESSVQNSSRFADRNSGPLSVCHLCTEPFLSRCL